jgi:hypothetical protein
MLLGDHVTWRLLLHCSTVAGLHCITFHAALLNATQIKAPMLAGPALDGGWSLLQIISPARAHR